jgi:hypothetical protein
MIGLEQSRVRIAFACKTPGLLWFGIHKETLDG